MAGHKPGRVLDSAVGAAARASGEKLEARSCTAAKSGETLRGKLMVPVQEDDPRRRL